MTPLVSVVVPLLADREAARRLLAQIPLDLRAEVIIAEAGSEPGLESIGEGRPDLKLIHAARGRGRQMNAAAGIARGEWLLFVHADSRLPAGWLDLFEAAVGSGAVGVNFRMNRASATRSPWVTANGWAMLRSPAELFRYETEGQASALAAAEAFAYDARAVIATDDAGLDPLGRMLKFLRSLEQPELPQFADIGVVDDGSSETGELMNLMSRGNLLYRIVKAPDPSLKLNVKLGTPEYPVAQAAEPHVLRRHGKEIGDREIDRAEGRDVPQPPELTPSLVLVRT
jgi:hypothetical protein